MFIPGSLWFKLSGLVFIHSHNNVMARHLHSVGPRRFICTFPIFYIPFLKTK